MLKYSLQLSERSLNVQRPFPRLDRLSEQFSNFHAQFSCTMNSREVYGLLGAPAPGSLFYFCFRLLSFNGPNSSSSRAIRDFVGCAPGRGMSAVGLTRNSRPIALSVGSGI